MSVARVDSRFLWEWILLPFLQWLICNRTLRFKYALIQKRKRKKRKNKKRSDEHVNSPLSWTSLDHRSLSLTDSHSILSMSVSIWASISALSSYVTPQAASVSFVFVCTGVCWQFTCSSAVNLCDSSCPSINTWLLLLLLFMESLSWSTPVCATGELLSSESLSEAFTRDSFKVSLEESFDGEPTMSYKTFLSAWSFPSLLRCRCFFLRSGEVSSRSGAALGVCLMRETRDPAETQKQKKKKLQSRLRSGYDNRTLALKLASCEDNILLPASSLPAGEHTACGCDLIGNAAALTEEPLSCGDTRHLSITLNYCISTFLNELVFFLVISCFFFTSFPNLWDMFMYSSFEPCLVVWFDEFLNSCPDTLFSWLVLTVAVTRTREHNEAFFNDVCEGQNDVYEYSQKKKKSL